MSANPLLIETIVSDPDVRNGRPTIAGTGLCVSDIVIAHTSGDLLAPDDLALHFRLSLGEVYAALSYYYLNKADVDAEIRQNAADARTLMEQLRQQGKTLE